jgi:hypothetical protein
MSLAHLGGTLVLGGIAFSGILPVAAEAQEPAKPAPALALRFYKGNTHTHTLNSDGDSAPDDVARWYREHGYAFLFLTDHNFLTSTEGINALIGADERFLLIPGEEVTDVAAGKPVHVNGLAVERVVMPQGGATVAEAMQRDVDAIRAARGVPHLNHPNFGWAVTTDDIKRLNNEQLFEVYNGHPVVNVEGGGGMPGLEEMWDAILSSGKLLYGLATDDAHHFKRPGDPTAAGPGRGWIYVRAPSLNARDIVDGIERGDFYASTGVVLDDIQLSTSQYVVKVHEEAPSRYRIRFIGRDGKVLFESTSGTASYTIRGDEGYVRAVVLESNGKRAWGQPVMLQR